MLTCSVSAPWITEPWSTVAYFRRASDPGQTLSMTPGSHHGSEHWSKASSGPGRTHRHRGVWIMNSIIINGIGLISISIIWYLGLDFRHDFVLWTSLLRSDLLIQWFVQCTADWFHWWRLSDMTTVILITVAQYTDTDCDCLSVRIQNLSLRQTSESED